jgi:hypothetical protein
LVISGGQLVAALIRRYIFKLAAAAKKIIYFY